VVGLSVGADDVKTKTRKNGKAGAERVRSGGAAKAKYSPEADAPMLERIAKATAICCGLCHPTAASILLRHRYPTADDHNDNDTGEPIRNVLNAAHVFQSLSPDEREIVADAIEHHLRITGNGRLIPTTKASPKNGKVRR